MEEYYMGGMFMPMCNAITDGSVLYFVITIGLTIVGNEWCVWEAVPKNYIYNGSPNLSIIHCCLIFSVTVQVLAVIRSINEILKHKRQIRDFENGVEGVEKPKTDGMPLEPKSFALQIFAYFFL